MMTNKPYNPFRPVPDDFLQVAPGKTQSWLKKHYRTSIKAVVRWQNETGVEKCKGPPPPPKPRREVPDDLAEVARTRYLHEIIKYYRTSEKVLRRWMKETGIQPGKRLVMNTLERAGQPWASKLTDMRQKTIYDDAADELRRHRWIVYRCTHKGVYARKGDYWRVGQVICTPDELLERAERARRKAA